MRTVKAGGDKCGNAGFYPRAMIDMMRVNTPFLNVCATADAEFQGA